MQITLSVQESKKVPPSLIECFKCFQQQFFRALQFYQTTSGQQPSTSTKQVSASKLHVVAATRTAADDHTSSSSTPKLLQNIITGTQTAKHFLQLASNLSSALTALRFAEIRLFDCKLLLGFYCDFDCDFQAKVLQREGG